MTAIGVVRGTRALGRDHRRPQRSFGCALRGERRTIARLLEPLEDLPADAQDRLAGDDGADVEQSLGVVPAVLVPQAIAALRDRADAAPLPVTDLADVV